jgi:hypothetical protein
MQPAYRKLRITWSVALAIACIAVVVLWARSYRSWHIAQREDADRGWLTRVGSSEGTVWFYNGPSPLRSSGWSFRELPHCVPGIKLLNTGPPQFECVISSASQEVRAPHWFLAAICGVVAGAPWLRWRFSLRTLLIVVTVLGPILGTIITTTR